MLDDQHSYSNHFETSTVKYCFPLQDSNILKSIPTTER